MMRNTALVVGLALPAAMLGAAHVDARAGRHQTAARARPVAVRHATAQPTDAIAKFDSGKAWGHLRQLVAIGPRPSGSPAIEQTRKYIKDQLAAEGLTPDEQAWDDQTPIDKVHMVNLGSTIPGARKERIVFA